MEKVAGHFFFMAAALVLFCDIGSLHAQKSTVDFANRQTAVRCLRVAEDYMGQQNWNEAVSRIRLGLMYDKSISDLWYLLAVSEKQQGSRKADILSLVSDALTESNWIDYNRDNARLLYADLLSDTGNLEKAITILDTEPFLYSADAEYIRIKTSYRMHTEQSIEKARDRMVAVQRIYSEDMRFPTLFFRYEAFLSDYGRIKTDPQVQRIADAFIDRVNQYENPGAELEIYAALFSTGEHQTRLLKAFAASGLKHPLYVILALRTGLITQQTALDSFINFADRSVTLRQLNLFAPLVTDPDVKKKFAEYLTAYSGTLTVDVDNNLEPNLVVTYERGRPVAISWDKNSDGRNEWTAVCDFGTPVSVNLPADLIAITYGTYPFVKEAAFSDKDGKEAVTFRFAFHTFPWTPFDLVEDHSLAENPGCSFFIPVVKKDLPELSVPFLMNVAASYVEPSEECPGATIHVALDAGKPVSADYFTAGTLYARTVFKDGKPVMRTTDRDGDGVFETTETFGYDPENSMRRTEQDKEQVMIDVFGHPVADNGLYVKMVQTDLNRDSVPDFTEEYLAGGGKISSWDQNGDGLWDIRFIKYPRKTGEPQLEDTFFYLMPEHELVTVSSADGNPFSVISGNVTWPVEAGEENNFYWVGNKGNPQSEQKVSEMLNLVGDQGVCIVTDAGSERILAVRIGNKKFGKIIPKLEDDGKNNENTKPETPGR